jgi:hypothetical protein
LYDEAKTGVVAGIAEGTYEIEVSDARALAQSRLLFLDLKVVSGPLVGRVAQVNLYLPEPGNRGAGFHFRNKIMGFGDLTETFKQMDSADDVAGALAILGDALTGRRVSADLELRSDGEYAGTNQLAKTKPADAPAPVAAVPAPAAEPVPAPAPAAVPEPALAGEVPF